MKYRDCKISPGSNPDPDEYRSQRRYTHGIIRINKGPHKDEREPSFATYIDDVITNGGRWKQISELLSREAFSRGVYKHKDKFTRGDINSHIASREKQDKDWLKKRGLTVRQTGIYRW